ncbi:MAG: hypothetical protein ABF868_01770 [Sporolactobacillus sp.]
MGTFIVVLVILIGIVTRIAKSVESQNTAEQRRRLQRQQQRGARQHSMPLVDSVSRQSSGQAASPGSEPSEMPENTRATLEHLKRGLAEQRSARHVSAPAKSFAYASRQTLGTVPGDRDQIRRAFLFSECIAAPRARRPYRYFQPDNHPRSNSSL